MNSISVLKESTKNPKENLLLETLNEMEKNNRKEIFSINNSQNKPKKGTTPSLSLPRQKIQKENSFSQNKKKFINQTIQKSENVLDFDRVLEVLLNPLPHPKNDQPNFLGIKKKLKLPPVLSNSSDKPKIKKKHSLHKHNNEIYNINNFCSNTMKIVEKKDSRHVECPKFQEIDLENYTHCLNEIELPEEDISDSVYLKYHNQYEQKEIDYKMKIFSQSSQYKKQKKKHKNNLVISIPLD